MWVLHYTCWGVNNFHVLSVDIYWICDSIEQAIDMMSQFNYIYIYGHTIVIYKWCRKLWIQIIIGEHCYKCYEIENNYVIQYYQLTCKIYIYYYNKLLIPAYLRRIINGFKMYQTTKIHKILIMSLWMKNSTNIK